MKWPRATNGGISTDQEERKVILESTLERLLGWIGQVDGRIQTTLAVDIALLGILAAKAPRYDIWWSLVGVSFTLGSGTLFASATMTFFAVFPRLTGPSESLIYFGAIAAMREDVFVRTSRGMTLDAYLADLERQCYRNALIAAHKFTWIRRSMSALFVAVPLWLVAVHHLYGGAP